METTLKINDCFNELCKSLRNTYDTMQALSFINRVVNRLNEEGLSIEQEDWGKPFKEYAANTGYTIGELFVICFPRHKPSYEDIEFFSGLLIFGPGECTWCGGELDEEHEGEGANEWVNTTCNNSACEFSDTTCPDFNTLPGGRDYK